MAIPIENIYYLLCYAYDHAASRNVIDVGSVHGKRIEALFAHVLARSTEHLLKRGIHRDYSPIDAVLRGVRNKILISETVSKGLQLRGELHCSFSDLTEDTLVNQLLRLTLKRLSSCEGVEREQRAHLRRLSQRIRASDASDARTLLAQLQMYGSLAHYRLVIAICRLLHEHAFAYEGESGARFVDFSQDDAVMSRIFEEFVRKFIAAEISAARLGKRRSVWMASGTEQDLRWLPGLEVDVPVVWPEGQTIIECKYYSNPTQMHHGKETIRSGHVNQLFAYLSNATRNYAARPKGLLLYASPGRELRVDFNLQGYDVQVRTLNLDQPWQAVDRALRVIVNDSRPRSQTVSAESQDRR